MPSIPPRPGPSPASRAAGFTLFGALASLACIGTLAAVAAPILARHLRSRAPNADALARNVESVVTRAVESAESAAAYLARRAAAPRATDPVPAPAAAVPDAPEPEGIPTGPIFWEVPVFSPVIPRRWRREPLFWQPFCGPPAAWRAHRPFHFPGRGRARH